ncbi:hypothetical protein [Pseudoxanthomonas suwonensis]|uniref:hypothetical protein n=1 Tax=Pseudoxanthomonas suwonensis TaxID=314722 RepID=UPI0012DE04EC|nr:hypothetical protein [Pseudoxanthomonas suwonensis]
MPYFIGGLFAALPLITLVSLNSAFPIVLQHDGASLYQFMRSGIPFFVFCVLIAGLSRAQEAVDYRLDSMSGSSRFLGVLVLLYAFGQALQVILFRAGIGLANAASSSEDGLRVLLFPTTATLLFFFYSLATRKYPAVFLFGFVIFATGSKTMLAAAALMWIFALIHIRAPVKIISLVLGGTLAATALVYLNPLAASRMATFLSNDKGEDITRAYEIAHAKATYMSSTKNIILGVGLSTPLTPGVPTNDPRWLENSKFDIENAYWSLIPKLGMVGCALLLFLFSRLPRDIVTVCFISILVIFGLKTSYQYFTTFDGSLLIISSLIVRYLLLKKKSSQGAP